MLGLGLALLQPSVVAAHVLPYVPTQILMPSGCLNESTCNGGDLAYIFSQNDDGVVQFSAVNYSTTVAAETVPQPITTILPFLGDELGTTAFGAARTSNGSVVVYAGACDGGGGSLWSYSGGSTNTGSSGSWMKRTTTPTGSTDEVASSRGPYFLGGTLAFSSNLSPTMDQPTIYTYGGMCSSPTTNSTTWQSSANYTKTMMSLAPKSQQDDTAYSLSIASTSGPKTPLAGFTLTQLVPSVTNISGTLTQQAGFVLLGGHTQQAFINMSTAAVWSLPAQTWSYVNIAGPDGTGDIDSRSGHTAVLTEDGSSILVFGGWVGDINTPAEPQLAILQTSQTYSSWKWVLPDAPPGGLGVYGHGAAMLPGNVMMVYGGWDISASPSKRQASAATSPRFFNVTSMTWSNSYTNPNPGQLSLGGGRPEAPGAGHDSAQTKRLGLGIGLGLGLALLLGVLAAFCVWRVNLRKRRAAREEAAQMLAQDAQYFMEHEEMAERNDHDAWYEGYGGYADASRDRSLGYESLRGARTSVDEGGADRAGGGIMRKPFMTRNMRGGYMPTENRISAFVSPPGQIHPILEDDEEEYHTPNQQLAEPTSPTSDMHSDPFLTPPPTATAPPVLFLPSQQAAVPPNIEDSRYRRFDRDVQGWVSDVDAADTLLDKYNNSRQGRRSPGRRSPNRPPSSVAPQDDDSRTGSNLSESARSAAADSLRRSQSNRKSNLSTTASFLSGMLLGAGTTTEHPKPSSSSSSSYNTARSGFGVLQAEGPSLLGRTRPSSPTGGAGYDDEEYANAPSSPSKSKPRRSWLGSIRRAFSQSSGTPPYPSPMTAETLDQYSVPGSDYEPRSPGLRGELLRRKQGRQDWEDGSTVVAETVASSSQPAENDWDIERAVEQRLVQVMFTVPKERLRVVNGGDEQPEEDYDTEHAAAQKGTAQIKKTDSGLHEPQVAEFVDLDGQGDETDVVDQKIKLGPHKETGDFLHADLSHHRFSHVTDDSGRRSSGVVCTAEAVTFQRPMTKVLQMVDSIESRSDGERSQSNSPSRGQR